MILPSNFSITKYGLFCRLADETDCEFILQLRTDSVLSRYIHVTDNNLESQLEWMRKYKLRERKGEDYYFIFLYQGSRVGVCRLYNIEDSHFTFGSWLFKKDAPFFCSAGGAIIAREIAFETLDFKIEIDKDGTNVNNKKVWKFTKRLGMVYDSERVEGDDVYLTGYMTKEAFETNKVDMCRFFPE